MNITAKIGPPIEGVYSIFPTPFLYMWGIGFSWWRLLCSIGHVPGSGGLKFYIGVQKEIVPLKKRADAVSVN